MVVKWNFGKVYKEVRESKGISQKKICHEALSRTTLSKLENCKIMPSYQTMEYLLQQINMSFSEFEYICNVYQPQERECIIEEFNSLINNTDKVNIKDLLKRCEKFLKITDDYYIKDIQMLLKAQLAFQLESMSSNVCKSKLLISQIWTRLEKMDVWYYNEIRLLNGILFYFPLETIEAISDKLLYSLKKYSTYAKIKDLEISILTNLSTIYLKNCKMAECENILLRMKQLALDLKRYDFLGVYFVRMGICEKNSVLIERGMKILTLTDENELIEELNKEIEFFKMTEQ